MAVSLSVRVSCLVRSPLPMPAMGDCHHPTADAPSVGGDLSARCRPSDGCRRRYMRSVADARREQRDEAVPDALRWADPRAAKPAAGRRSSRPPHRAREGRRARRRGWPRPPARHRAGAGSTGCTRRAPRPAPVPRASRQRRSRSCPRRSRSRRPRGSRPWRTPRSARGRRGCRSHTRVGSGVGCVEERLRRAPAAALRPHDGLRPGDRDVRRAELAARGTGAEDPPVPEADDRLDQVGRVHVARLSGGDDPDAGRPMRMGPLGDPPCGRRHRLDRDRYGRHRRRGWTRPAL